MLRIVSSTLTVNATPTIAPTTLVATASTGLAARFALSRRLEAIGSVVIQGQSGDSAAGWQVGFVQAQWIETNWATYRGTHDHDGSLILQRARPPSRPHQACFDNQTAGMPFYADAGNVPQVPAGGHTPLPFTTQLPPHPTFPLTVQVFHADRPGDSYDLAHHHSKTGKTNLLREVQLEFSFCAVLVVREPTGRRHFAKGFYWNVNWQDQFRTTSAAASLATPVVAGTSTNVGRVFEGKPEDRRFRPIFDHPQATNCNTVATAAANHPNVRQEARWNSFDVRR